MEKFVIARKIIHVNGAKTSNLFQFFFTFFKNVK